MSVERGETHPSEALLPTFGHDRLEVELLPILDPTRTVRTGTHVLNGSFLVLMALALAVGLSGEGELALVSVPILVSVWLGSLAVVRAQDRRVHLSLRHDRLVVEHRVGRWQFRRQEVPLATVRAVHAVDTYHQGIARRGLRVAIDGGEELFVAAPAVPVESLTWLAEEIRVVGERAAERAAGEAPQELVAMLSDDGRRRADLARQRSARLGQAG